MKIIYRSFIEKLFSLFITLFILFWASIPIHEGFHYLSAKSLGIQSTIDLSWGFHGVVYFNSQITDIQKLIILFAGGIGTGLLFSFLWYISCKQMKYTIWEVDDAFSFCLLSIYQFLYSPLDYFYLWQNQYLLILISLLSIGISLIIYGKKIFKWILLEN